ncbi:MAG: right-handed parallel beta-helix repeat-containing protein [Myxococcota bacterium]
MLLLVGSSPALAVDGVIEINQAAALAGGITACDGPGFPVSLCSSGSYRLTSNLTYATGRGIEILTDDVTLDLNGMTISGPTTCTVGVFGWVTSCTTDPAISNFAIAVGQSAQPRIRNGVVRGAEGGCVDVSSTLAAVLEDLVLTNCGSHGVLVGSRTSLTRVRAIGNRGVGILGTSQSPQVQLRDVIVTNNGSLGITLWSGSEVSDLVTAQNAGAGIELGTGGMLANFSSTGNLGNGVKLGDGSLARSGVVRDNGVALSASCGVQGQGGAGYREVVITAAAGGNPATACGPGLVNLGNNTCQGTTCPP